MAFMEKAEEIFEACCHYLYPHRVKTVKNEHLIQGFEQSFDFVLL